MFEEVLENEVERTGMAGTTVAEFSAAGELCKAVF